jgi:hypothetical protein
MKLSYPSLLGAMALGLALAPAISRADYQPADRALEKLEAFVTLTPTQEKQALQIYQNLKDVMDSMDPATRPTKGAQSRQDALAAIRAILTPEQQAIYDQTPPRLGGGAKTVDPAMRALNQKIRAFVTGIARNSPEITAQVGTVQKVAPTQSGSMTTMNGAYADPALHPESGTNVVTVTGSAGTKTFKISWTMSDAGEMTAGKVGAAGD